MKYCFGSVSWSGYLERYVDVFVDNYIRLFKELIRVGVNYIDIADPVIVMININIIKIILCIQQETD